MITPNLLYHYTSIESLSYILSNRNIKFNRLDKVDDIQDGRSKDISSIGKFYFISSWTDLSEESLPFWNMYTPDMQGVRIAMKKFPFNYYVNRKNGLIKIKHETTTKDRKIRHLMPFKIDPFNSIFKNDVGKMNLYFNPNDKFLSGIEYLSNCELEKIYYFPVGASIGVAPNKIGSYKLNIWNFQNEWRYKIIFLPKTLFLVEENKINELVPNWIDKIENESILTQELYLDIEEEAFKNMIIRLGPKTSKSDRILVESLIYRYGRNIKIEESSLKGLIR